MGNPDDELNTLLQRVALQDHRALTTLHRKASPSLKRLAFRLLNDTDLCEDVIQETFMQIWLNAAQYCREQGRPMTWMRTILRYRALDRLKAEQREHKRRNLLEADLIVLGKSHAPCPTDELEAKELRTRFLLQLQTLSSHRQEAVTLAYLHNLSREDIAKHQQLSVGTVKSHLHRGLIELRQEMSL